MDKQKELRSVYLESVYDKRKSFYRKAYIIFTDNTQILYSYGTKVAKIENEIAVVYGKYSQITSRHIKEFLLQNNFKAENMKQMLRDYKCIYEK